MKDNEKALELLRKYVKGIENGDLALKGVSVERRMNSACYDGISMTHIPTNFYFIGFEVIDLRGNYNVQF